MRRRQDAIGIAVYPTPEPASLTLWTVGLLGGFLLGRRNLALEALKKLLNDKAVTRAFLTNSDVIRVCSAKFAFDEIEETVEPVYYTDIRGEALWDTLTLWTMLVAGILKLGSILRFVSNAVMVGFISGVGINIVLGQLGDFTGYDADGSNRLARTLASSLSPVCPRRLARASQDNQPTPIQPSRPSFYKYEHKALP